MVLTSWEDSKQRCGTLASDNLLRLAITLPRHRFTTATGESMMPMIKKGKYPESEMNILLLSSTRAHGIATFKRARGRGSASTTSQSLPVRISL
eukprot:3521226-Amphidinium_carterae.1